MSCDSTCLPHKSVNDSSSTYISFRSNIHWLVRLCYGQTIAVLKTEFSVSFLRGYDSYIRIINFVS